VRKQEINRVNKRKTEQVENKIKIFQKTIDKIRKVAYNRQALKKNGGKNT